MKIFKILFHKLYFLALADVTVALYTGESTIELLLLPN